MYILKEGRVSFLEFLRNLTPQILLLSLAFVVGAKLDLAKFDLANWAQTLIFISLLGLAILSTIANVSLFLGKFAPINDIRSMFTKVDLDSPIGWKTKCTHMFRAKGKLVEVILVLIMIELSVVVIFIHAMQAAMNIGK